MKGDELVQKLVDSYGNWVQADCENQAGGTARFTKELYPYDTLFSPIKVNRLTIKNRTVMAPMGNCQMADETGRPDDKLREYFFARAAGGIGLLTTGLIPISHHIDASVTEKGNFSYFPRIDNTRTNHMGGRDLATGVHARGGRIFIQLTAGLGRVGPPTCLLNKYQLPVSSSWNPNFYIPEIPCRPLTDMELDKIVKNFGQGAADAQTMGLDGVYLHGHEGYLLDQMTNTAFNRRKLGKYSDWQRFGIEIIKELRRRTGRYFPIMYRIDLSCALNETYGERMHTVKSLKNFTEGRTIGETLEYMENLVKAGVDIFDVDLGCYDNWWLPHPPSYMPAGCFLEVAKAAKDYFDSRGVKSLVGEKVPIVAVGKLGYPDLAEKALRDGMCDMIMLGRPVLADPNWCNKAYAGEVEKIRPCIGCQEACVNEFVEGGHPQCAVNARTGFEDVVPRLPIPAETPKKIAVIGGGPAGMNFAIQAAKRGHTVKLYEKSGALGGAMIPASVPLNKYDMANYVEYIRRETLSENGVEVLLNTEATTQMLKGKEYDAVVYAVGAKRFPANFPGSDKVNMVEATELLTNPQLLGGARRVVVMGGGAVGMETAFWLSYEKGCKVTVMDMLPYFMDGACTANRGHLIHYLEKNGVTLANCATIARFEDHDKVLVSRNISKGVPDPYCTWTPTLPKNIPNPLAPKIGPESYIETYLADLFVNALGNAADESQYLEGLKARVAPEVYNIGDSFHAGFVKDATRAGFNLANQI